MCRTFCRRCASSCLCFQVRLPNLHVTSRGAGALHRGSQSSNSWLLFVLKRGLAPARNAQLPSLGERKFDSNRKAQQTRAAAWPEAPLRLLNCIYLGVLGLNESTLGSSEWQEIWRWMATYG